MTTYGDTLAGWLNGAASDGTGLWALLILFVAVLVFVAAIIILIRVVKTAIDAV